MNYGIPNKIEYDRVDGYFKPNKSIIDEIKSNIKNWLSTNPGERIMMPDYGFGPNTFLFSANPENTSELMKSKINEGFSKWFPFIKINSINSKVLGKNIQLTLDLSFKGKEFTIEYILSSVL